MSKQPLGKTLLRNVIRHTDAHNKIQEETEMWKMRGWEVQGSDGHPFSNKEGGRGQMHCDRVSDQPRDLSHSRVSEHDDREARYWSRKLYEFESNDRDRWGHSGFKELYPEEFESDSERNVTTKIGRHKVKKSKSQSASKLSKQSKKSFRHKKRKKKKDENEKSKKAVQSSSSSSSDDSSPHKEKHRRKKNKSRHRNKKNAKTKRRDEDSISGDSNDEEREKSTRIRKKRKQESHRDSDPESNLKKKQRKNWKAAGEASSHGSSGD